VGSRVVTSKGIVRVLPEIDSTSLWLGLGNAIAISPWHPCFAGRDVASIFAEFLIFKISKFCTGFHACAPTYPQKNKGIRGSSFDTHLAGSLFLLK
jgi:hypothetical protein